MAVILIDASIISVLLCQGRGRTDCRYQRDHRERERERENANTSVLPLIINTTHTPSKLKLSQVEGPSNMKNIFFFLEQKGQSDY